MSYEATHIGPYELRGELGRGAMARVWRAWDPALEREVAIKEPLFDERLPQTVLDEMARRFVAEGRAAARLSHPGIVTTYATDVFDGRPALVMELVEGSTLSSLLAGGPLSPDVALSILDQLLEAVGYAHEHGVVHRDIKPDNIFVTPAGQVKLADFGIARIEGAGATRLTAAGSVLGTPGYMSPEQATGRSVDARSDLFSVGVVAYEMLTGEIPFAAGSPDTTTLIYRIVHEPAPSLSLRAPGVSRHVATAIMAALEKNPAARPQSADEFRALLRGGAADDAPQRTWLPYALVAAVGIIVLVVAFVSATTGGGSAPAPVAAAISDAQDGAEGDEPEGEAADRATDEAVDEAADQTTSADAGAPVGTSDDDTAADDAAATPDPSGFSEQDPPYRLTKDEDGTMALYDAHGRRMTDPVNFVLDVSYLPAWAVAQLEHGVTFDSYEEARHEFDTTDDDCLPPANVMWGYDRDAAPADPSEKPFWCIVVDVYPTREEAERVAQKSAEEFGVEVSVLPTIDWQGLFYAYEFDKRTKSGEGYCVVTGVSDTYQEVLEHYLKLSEIMGQPLDQQVRETITSKEESWRLLSELDEIKYGGTRQHIKRR